MRLRDATDLDLLEAGLVDLESLEQDGPVLGDALACVVIFNETTDHDWSKTKVVEVDGYTDRVQLCANCGCVRRSPF